MEIPLNTVVPTAEQIAYTPPSLPTLLSLSAYLVLLSLPTLLSNAYSRTSNLSQRATPTDKNNSDSNFQHNSPNHGVESTQPRSSPLSYTLNPALTLLLPLFIGAVLGPSITSESILSTSTQRTLIDIGYIGLLLLIFEAGASLDAASLKLMRDNSGLSTVVAITGVLLPIALSMGLEMGVYGYSGLEAFASGAALSSTSLGTTLALLAPPGPSEKQGGHQSSGIDLKRTRVGCVLVCAALLDDVLGLVIAGIIPGLAEQEPGINSPQIQWQIIVRPLLVSIAFGIGTPIIAMGLKRVIKHSLASKLHVITRRQFDAHHAGETRDNHLSPSSNGLSLRPELLCLIIIFTLFTFVAGSGYAGTSELFGAYLAGALVGHVFGEECTTSSAVDENPLESRNPAHEAFTHYLQPLLTHLLGPIFFASIGTALPIKAMFTTYPHAIQVTITGVKNAATTVKSLQGKASHQVIWRGLIYSILMVLAKMAVGLWMLLWPTSTPAVDGDRDRRSICRIISMIKKRCMKTFSSPFWRRQDVGSKDAGGVDQHEIGPEIGSQAQGNTLRDSSLVTSSKSKIDLKLKDVEAKGVLTPLPTTTPTTGQLERGLETKTFPVDGPESSTASTSISTVPRSLYAPSASTPGQSGLLIYVDSRQLVPYVADDDPSHHKSALNASTSTGQNKNSSVVELTRVRSALLLGIAMVARGEIALIIAQLARPLLVDSKTTSTTSTSVSDAGSVITATTTLIPDEEAFAVVIWAVLVSTIGGALGVGVLMASWKRRDERKLRSQRGTGD